MSRPIDRVMKFLRRKRVIDSGYNMALNYLPWYLLIGAPGSGKTSLLANANIRFNLDEECKNENSKVIPIGETCDWWVMRDLVFVDVPGAYVVAKDERPSMTNRLWLAFIAMIKRMRGQYGLDSVVITFSVEDLMDRERREESLLHLRSSIATLKDTFGRRLPFYIAITKCDLLPGFVDFFGECSAEELEQAWGVSMPVLSANDSLVDTFATRFDALIRKLNQQLLLRLHQERDAYLRIYIKDFPLHVERLKEGLLVLLKGLMVKESFLLKGVYLTSSQSVITAARACFVKQFILHALAPIRRYNDSSKSKNTIKRILYDIRGR